ncbi:uncharacterized protein V1510DRAFT_409390 [Dipodascopsis tothii]|uniref:uncharacterized protein n=1 Tax=Dipodascopsis tothii TaxID=44089 RepID=UPI0034CD5FB8
MILDYSGKLILAPMVRTGELPTRLLALRYGADLVWSPEIVDKKIIGCKRIYNDKLNCIDFVKVPSNTLVFRTHAVKEHGRLIFQLGSASPDLAVAAAKVVVGDVAGIDLNSGCPKHFSIHSGMGAALLKTPDKLVAILESLVEQIGKPHNIGISVKIRILETPEETFTLVRRLVATGISALTVHCRKTYMRPREAPLREHFLKEIAQICRDAGVTCIANGGITCKDEMEAMTENYGVDSCMLAQAPEKNLSCFRSSEEGGELPALEVATSYFDIAREVDNALPNTKFCLLKTIPGNMKDIFKKVAQAKSFGDIAVALGADEPECTVQELHRKRVQSLLS